MFKTMSEYQEIPWKIDQSWVIKMASLDSVYSTLKACVISNSGGVDEDNLNSEYRQLIGSSIPWRDFGFNSLQELIKASPCLQIVTRNGRKVVVAETSGADHLSAMISKQKKPSSSRRKRWRPSVTNFLQRGMSERSSKRGVSFKGISGGDFGPDSGGYNSKIEPNKLSSGSKSRSKPAGGGGNNINSSSSRNKSSNKKIDIVEKNNNTNMNAVQSHNNNAISNNKNGRPASDSFSSGNSSLALSHQETKQIELNKKNKKSDKKKQTPKQTESSKPVKPINDNKSKTFVKPEDLVKPVLRTNIFSSQPNQIEENSMSKEVSKTSLSLPNTYMRSSQKILLGQSNCVMPDPVYMLPPITLNNTFIPDNLVPPKPMKRASSYRANKRRSPVMGLMSIKDESPPSENSKTAKFINLIKTQEWPDPEYRILPRIGPNKVKVYGCTVRGSYCLGDNDALLTYDFSTIPNEFPDMNASKEAVSEKAFLEMSQKIKDAADYVPITCNKQLIIERVYNIVKEYTHGLWAYKVESDYKNKFGERLPSKWVDIITNSDLLVAEKLADFSYVIAPAKESHINVLSEPSVEMSLGKLEYPDTDNWDIYVTKIISSTQVWFRFVGANYSDSLDEVAKQMCDFYQDWTKFICPSLNIGHVYIYPSSLGAIRVKLLSFDSDDTVTIMYIDHGEIEQIPKDHLCVLDHKFRNLPPQAVCCRLFNLEEYEYNSLCTAFLIDKIEGMVLVAEVVDTESLQLIMYDTSFDEPVNLNMQFIDLLKLDLVTPPSMSKEINVQEAVVTSIWKTGEIYLQLPNQGLTHLNLQLKAITDIPDDHYLTSPEQIRPDVLYLISYNNVLNRATVLPPARPVNNMVELFLIDTGHLLSAVFTDLVLLSPVSMVLCEIPRQAVRVKLSGVQMNESTVERLEFLLLPPCNPIVKLISYEPSLEVEIYVRGSNGLLSVNETLLFEENLPSKLKNISIDNTPGCDFVTIKPAQTPDCSEYFDVYVVSVSNPSNFTVIPYKYIKELSKLQNRLQSHYNFVNTSLWRLRNFNIGQACAVQHSDMQWYRGLIEQVMDVQMSQLMIRFCDFGNFAMISPERLLSLDRSFLDLPALGFNASIADVVAISGDWDITDCVRTQELMLEKNLVTIIKSKRRSSWRIQVC